MRNFIFLIVFSIVFIIYGALNYYIGRRGWQALGSHIPFLNSKVYWAVFGLVVFSYIFAHFAKEYLPLFIGRWFTVIGSYWLAFMFYFFLILVVIDFVRLLNKFVGIIPASVQNSPWAAPAAGVIAVILVTGIVSYGSWNARHARVASYEINIPKKAGSLTQLHAVMVADIHLGSIVDSKWLDRMAAMVNKQNPDIIFVAGDLVDEAISPAEEPKLTDAFCCFRAKYGVYMVPGNHEYISGHAGEVFKYLESVGVHVLRDRYEKVGGSFYVVGREDSSGHTNPGSPPKKLTEVMDGVDRSLPVILLHHQPTHLEEAREAGADLQLSGHTHAGQLWPDRWITSRIYENDWGLLKKGNLNVIVTSGFGLWGPPVRTGNYPEIVDITINFK